MKRNTFLFILLILGISGCDPVHNLKLDNQTSRPVIVIYRPFIDLSPTDSKIESFDVNGVTFEKRVLGAGQNMRIGNVVARYTPRPDDVELDYLKVCMDNDTMKLIGKKSIFSAIQKVDKLDWRLILKDQ